MPSYAKLRPLEPIPIQAEGQQLVVLRDPARYVTNDVTVTVPVYLLLCLIDGTRSVLELQADFKEHTTKV